MEIQEYVLSCLSSVEKACGWPWCPGGRVLESSGFVQEMCNLETQRTNLQQGGDEAGRAQNILFFF